MQGAQLDRRTLVVLEQMCETARGGARVAYCAASRGQARLVADELARLGRGVGDASVLKGETLYRGGGWIRALYPEVAHQFCDEPLDGFVVHHALEGDELAKVIGCFRTRRVDRGWLD